MPRLHELTVEQVVLGGAAPEVFHAFQAALLASLKPEGELELTLAENIVVAQWGLRRCRVAETTLATGAAAASASDPLVNWSVHPEMRQIDATVRRHERSLERNLRLLRELQTEREFRRLAQIPLGSESTEAPPLANASKARRAFIAERAARQRFNQSGVKSALNEFLNQPPARESDVTFERFRDE